MKDRAGYIARLDRWMEVAESFWNPGQGTYGPDVRANAQLVPALVVQAQQGRAQAAERACHLVRRLVSTPPWDPQYHYFNTWDALGLEPHIASSPIASGLAIALIHASEIRLDKPVQEAVAGVLGRFSAKFAEWVRPVATGWRLHRSHLQGPLKNLLDHAGGIEPYSSGPDPEFGDYLLVEGFGALHRTLVEKGLRPDLRYFEFWGPDNQECWVMRAVAHAWLATGDAEFLRHLERMWTAVIARVEDGCGLPHPGGHGFVEDFSFHYSASPLSNYEMSVYDHAMLALYADVIRIQRRAGCSLPEVEKFFRRWAWACQTRIALCDGTSNPALNLAGWERTYCLTWHSTWTWPLAALPDLSLLAPQEIRHVFDRSLQDFEADLQAGRQFPAFTGLVGHSQPGGRLTDLAYRCYELALCLLTEPGFFALEPRPFSGWLSSLAWKDLFFVAQTPRYLLTVVGAGPGYDADRDHGTPLSGGEYHLKLPYGPFLTPLADAGRTSVWVEAEGRTLSSKEVCLHRLEQTRPRMEVTLADGQVLSSGKPFGDLLYAPRTCSSLFLRVGFGNQQLRVERCFGLESGRVEIVDRVIALEKVRLDRACSRLPVITIDPQGRVPRIAGVSAGKAYEFFPPLYLCVEGQCAPDRALVQSLRYLGRLAVDYGEYGYSIEQLSDQEIRLDLTSYEWLENRRMRVAGKNLDCAWVFEPILLEKGQSLSFHYALVPFAADRTIPVQNEIRGYAQ